MLKRVQVELELMGSPESHERKEPKLMAGGESE